MTGGKLTPDRHRCDSSIHRSISSLTTYDYRFDGRLISNGLDILSVKPKMRRRME